MYVCVYLYIFVLCAPFAAKQYQLLLRAKTVLADEEMRAKYDAWRYCGLLVSWQHWLALQDRTHAVSAWAAVWGGAAVGGGATVGGWHVQWESGATVGGWHVQWESGAAVWDGAKVGGWRVQWEGGATVGGWRVRCLVVNRGAPLSAVYHRCNRFCPTV